MDRLGPTAIAVGVIVLAATGVAAATRLERPWLQAWAVLRAVVQLGLLSLVLAGVVRSIALTIALILVGIGVAAWTAAGRAGLPRIRALQLAPLLAVAVAVPVAIVFLVGALPFSARFLLAMGGILTGNAMTAASLTGRTLARDLVAQRDEVEGWLALGAPMRRATRQVVRAAASTALLPGTDQTRTTGLVALPGAFVGAVFGGASILDAARFQVVVLAAILLVGVVVATAVGRLLADPGTLPVDAARLR